MINGQWYEFDDQYVTEVHETLVQNAEAYVLFYRWGPRAPGRGAADEAPRASSCRGGGAWKGFRPRRREGLGSRSRRWDFLPWSWWEVMAVGRPRSRGRAEGFRRGAGGGLPARGVA